MSLHRFSEADINLRNILVFNSVLSAGSTTQPVTSVIWAITQ